MEDDSTLLEFFQEVWVPSGGRETLLDDFELNETSEQVKQLIKEFIKGMNEGVMETKKFKEFAQMMWKKREETVNCLGIPYLRCHTVTAPVTLERRTYRYTR